MRGEAVQRRAHIDPNAVGGKLGMEELSTVGLGEDGLRERPPQLASIYVKGRNRGDARDGK